MRLLNINNEYPPLGGGTATVTAAICQRLQKFSDISPILITGGVSKQPPSNEADSTTTMHIIRLPLRQQCIHHASVFDLATFAIKALLFLVRSAFHRSTDIILAWSTLPAGLIGYILYRTSGMPYVVRVCGPDIPGFERRYQRLYPFLTPLLRIIWRNAHTVICKCEDEAARVRAVLPKTHIQIVPNGVDTTVFFPATARQQDQTLSILCVARLIERKGQAALIRALATLGKANINATLTLVGDGDSFRDYQQLAQDLGVQDRVFFRGALERHMLPEVYRSADLFVLASEAESMSVACLEALASGLPLVVTHVGGVEQFVINGENGFIVPVGDQHALENALFSLADDCQRRISFSKRSREIAAFFSWDITTAKIASIVRLAATAKSV